MATTRVTTLRLATGTGRLCRTEHGILYVPVPGDGWEDLVRAARTAGSEDGIAAVATALAERELDAPPFVYVSWRPRVAVLVFGDVELRTDQRAVPMLSGAGSQTWVEHSVPAVGGEVELFVTPPDDDDTDLVAGTVPAGGFRLNVSVAAASAGEVRPDPDLGAVAPSAEPRHLDPPEPPASISTGAEAPAGAAQEPEPSTSTPADPSPDPSPTTAEAIDPATDGGDWRPPGVDLTDPQSALEAIQAAAVPEDHQAPPQDAWSAPTGPPIVVDDDEDVTTDGPPAPGETAGEGGDHRSLVEAVACSNGHPNPPGRGSCRSCDGLIPPGAAVSTVPRPSLGAIELDDGTRVELTGDLVLGRRPDVAEGTQAVTVEGDRVSRTHAELSMHGWEVRLRDRDSRNGTFVWPPGSNELVRVEADVPVRLEPGTVVYLGTRSFVLDGTGT